jgi:hypothetical protein
MSARLLSILLVLLGCISYPSLYKSLAGLEAGGSGPETPLRAAQSIGFFALAGLVLVESHAFPHPTAHKALALFLIVSCAELILRVFFKQIAPHFKPASAVRRMTDSVWKYSNTLGEYAWMEPHPFLQFTQTRGMSSGGIRNLGFADITISDIPKPEGVIRVACLGNSTTCDGYPEALEDFLNDCGQGQRFQVLNFGLGWWASVHSMLNFVLNVRDFHPDFVVVHENCNDEKYRGYPGLRGDYAHCTHSFSIERHRDEWLYRFSLLYRLAVILVCLKSPRSFYRPKIGVAMNRGKTRDYVPEELTLFRRNIKTICDLAGAEGIRIILTTMPFSKILRYTDFDETRFHPHLLEANAILRELAEDEDLTLVDLESLFMDRDNFFADPFHLGPSGVKIKALCIGEAILTSLGKIPTPNSLWRSVGSLRLLL